VLLAPTETVYGLMTDWANSAGRERIFVLKQRPEEKLLQMLAADLEMAQTAGVKPDVHLAALAAAFWPGPLTVVCNALDGTTIGLRIPQHAFIQDVLRALGRPLAATSANRSGMTPPHEVAEALQQLDGMPDLAVDGGRIGNPASTVVSIVESQPRLLREGQISLAQIEAVLSQWPAPGDAA
jgi:L-threonylcarbamoyladenylate synthase